MSDIDFKSLSTGTNILTRFRTFNTVFTFSAISPTTLGTTDDTGGINVTQVEKDTTNPNYIIAKSSGKGAPTKDQDSMTEGQYDFYFDNLEINTLPAFNERTNFTKSTNLNFTLVEPYSVGGLFQALAVTAANANYATFQSANYVLKIEFIGYADDDDYSPTSLGHYGTRYFPLKITEIDVKADAGGTVYNVKGIPCNEMTLADSDRLQADINVSGDTVDEILTDFFNKINSTSVDQYLKSHPDLTADDKNHDTFEFKFPDLPDGSPNPFKTSKFVYDVNRKDHESETIKPTDATFVNRKGIVVNPRNVTKGQNNQEVVTKASVQFSATAKISDCISAILRDCQYIRDTLSQIDAGTGLDKNNMFTYFHVSVQGLPDSSGRYDLKSGTGVVRHIYNIIPYKHHKSKLPQYQSESLGPKDITPYVRRTYNYLYTGMNTEVLNFGLKYNNLYFQTRPINEGYNKNLSNMKDARSPETDTDAASGKTYVKSVDQNKKTDQLRPIRILNNYKTAGVELSGEGTGPLPTDPWSIAAKNVHQALLEDTNMLQTEIEILGDPYYIIQGGVGNMTSKADSDFLGITSTGDADHQNADIYVNVNVNSIIDINKNTGMAMGSSSAAFSGLYRIIEIISLFREGVFTQKLKMIRINSQIQDTQPEMEWYS